MPQVSGKLCNSQINYLNPNSAKHQVLLDSPISQVSSLVGFPNSARFQVLLDSPTQPGIKSCLDSPTQPGIKSCLDSLTQPGIKFCLDIIYIHKQLYNVQCTYCSYTIKLFRWCCYRICSSYMFLCCCWYTVFSLLTIFCYSLALPVAVVYSEIIIDVLAPVVAGSDCQCQYCCCCGLS